MGIADLGASALSKIKKAPDNIKQNLGAIEKAVIEIYDLRSSSMAGVGGDPVTLNCVRVDGPEGSPPSPAITTMGGGDNEKVGTHLDQRSVADILTLAAGDDKDLKEKAKTEIGKMTNLGDGTELQASGITRKQYTVQFNPGSVQISAHGGGYIKKLNFQGENGQQSTGDKKSITYDTEDVNVIMTIPLFFDRCDPADAFMLDKFTNASLTELAKGVTKGILRGTGVKEVSVQKEVEGFIGMLLNRHTRFITFHWGDMNYSGAVTDVDARYTMFNVTGQPVRATVNLTMILFNEAMKASKAIWAERYKKIYKGKDSDWWTKTEGVGSAIKRNTGNFLNL